MYFVNAVGHHNTISSVFSVPHFAGELPHPEGSSVLKLQPSDARHGMCFSRDMWTN